MAKPDDIKPLELDRIYNDPDTALALDLTERFRGNGLSEAGLKEFLGTLLSLTPPERAKIEQVITNPGARADADLSTRGNQLAWAAALGHISQSGGQTRSSGVWRTLTRNPDLQNSFGTAARYLDQSLTNRDATMDWGAPGSWFWFSPNDNHINIDLFHTLTLGFSKPPAPGMKGIAHATGVMLHEVGHSQLTTRWSDGMKTLQEQEEKLLAGREIRELTGDEHKQLARIRTEFMLRHNVMNATEDNCVNRFAVNQSRDLPYDFGESMNICNIVLQGTGHYLKTKESAANGGHSDFSEILKKMTAGPKQKEIQKAGEAMSNLSKAIMMAFYSTNGLFETKDIDTWKRLGIDPDTITGVDGSTFNDLMEKNLAADGIVNLQPPARAGWLLRSVFSRSIESYADRRCEIIDDIWDKYAAHYAKVLIDAAAENALNIVQVSENIPATPQQSQEKERQGKDDIDPDNAKTVRDLAREAKQRDKKDAAPQDKDGEQQPPSRLPQADSGIDLNAGAGRQRGVDLANLAHGSWREFRKRINELEPVISRVADDFVYIRNKQKQFVRGLSKNNEQQPRGGDLRQRLDMRAQANYAAKRATGQKIEEDDQRRWRKDEVKAEATSVELWILGDGSSSMTEPLPGGGRRIDSAVQSMAILYEAGRRADFDTFIGMWGDDEIRLLAAPGDPDLKIGDSFERVRDGIHSGTKLSPAFAQAVQRSSTQETDARGKTKRFAGMTHFLIISDGELNGSDVEPLTQMITKLFRYGPRISVDIAVLAADTNSAMSTVVTKVRQTSPGAAIGIINASNAKDIPILLAQKIKQRFEQSGTEIKAVPDTQKREAFASAYKALIC